MPRLEKGKKKKEKWGNPKTNTLGEKKGGERIVDRQATAKNSREKVEPPRLLLVSLKKEGERGKHNDAPCPASPKQTIGGRKGKGEELSVFSPIYSMIAPDSNTLKAFKEGGGWLARNSFFICSERGGGEETHLLQLNAILRKVNSIIWSTPSSEEGEGKKGRGRYNCPC